MNMQGCREISSSTSLQSYIFSATMNTERTGYIMKFIPKKLLAPIMLIFWIVELICKLALKLSSVVFVVIAILFALASIPHFSDGNTLNGCICLVIAFLLSPYGLPKLAIHLVAWLIAMRILLKEKIYG